MAKARAKRSRPRGEMKIVAIATTAPGAQYLGDLAQGVLRGEVGRVALSLQARTLIEALHRVATGGSATVSVTGGSPEALNNLLDAHIAQLNQVNAALGFVIMDS